MVSMSPRWPSEKLCADAAGGVPQSASANSTGASKRNEAMGKILLVKAGFPKTFGRRLNLILVAVFAGQRLCSDDVVSLDPSGRADGETGLCARRKFARGLVVAAEKGGLRRRQIGLREISLSAVGHRELGIAERSLGLSCHRRAQNRNCFFRIGFIISCHERLPK